MKKNLLLTLLCVITFLRTQAFSAGISGSTTIPCGGSTTLYANYSTASESGCYYTSISSINWYNGGSYIGSGSSITVSSPGNYSVAVVFNTQCEYWNSCCYTYSCGFFNTCCGGCYQYYYSTTTRNGYATLTNASPYVNYYLDADNDNYHTGSPVYTCSSPGANYKTSTLGYDCNDANPAIHTTYPFYADTDGDGIGAGTSSSQCAVNASTPPNGYSLTNTDCAPTDNTKWQTASLYIDNDNDNYDNGTATVCYGASIPAGYKATTLGADCDDNDINKHTTYPFYADTDGDGVGAGTSSNQCAVNASTPPNGYSLTNTDCAPTDNTKWQTASLYIDNDNDNYDNGTATICYGASIPAGYKATTLGTDCDDNDVNKHTTYPFYADTDGDGVGAGTSSNQCAVNASTPPSGYSLTNTDCDDTNPAYTQPVPPAVSIAVYNGTTNICAGSPVTFTATPVNGGTAPSYKWFLNNVLVQNGSSNTYAGSSIVTNDQIRCELTSNSACASTPTANSSTLTMQVINPTAAPATPGTITGTTVVCAASTHSYSIAAVADATQYFWYFPQGTTFLSGQGSTNVTVTYPANLVSGAIKVEARNCRGISALSTVTLSILPKPAMPAAISGNTKVCPGTYSYTCPTANNASSYLWAVPANATILSGQGTTSVSIQFTAAYTTGAIQVAAINCKGTSANRSLTVSAYTTLAAPSAIAGLSTAVCSVTTGLGYSINPVAGATGYIWTVTGGTITSGQNTTAITVDFPSVFTNASVSVSAINACVQSAVKTLTITQKPAKPNDVSGPASACMSTPNIYTTTAVAGATSYNWTLPAGWNLISGGSTNSITVAAGTSGGNIKVSAVNACGSSAFKSTAVGINLGCRTFTPSAGEEESDLYIEEENEFGSAVKVYPNPFTDRFILEFSSVVNGKATVKLHDVAGRLMLEQIVKAEQGNNQTEINIGNQASGIYMLTLQQGNVTSRMRVIKN